MLEKFLPKGDVLVRCVMLDRLTPSQRSGNHLFRSEEGYLQGRGGGEGLVHCRLTSRSSETSRLRRLLERGFKSATPGASRHEPREMELRTENIVI